MKTIYALLAGFLLLANQLDAQCSAGQKQVVIEIVPDNYPQEITWVLRANGVQIANGNFNGATICVDASACIQFTIYDSHNDGICCGFGSGYYNFIVDGVTVGTGGNFQSSASHVSGCGPGTFCNDPLVITEGSYVAPMPNTFYSFTPTVTGIYKISTCNLTTCDTKLWVYSTCNNYVYNNDNMGTIFYDDDGGGCGLRAVIDAYMAAGETYLIRVGKYQNATCNSGIPFELTFQGAITGCMDPAACNYNPLATIQGDCYYAPDPNCASGPDLMIVESAVVNSLEIRQEYATNCMVEEGCMNGYGNRTVLAFDTHIKNIGDMDYYVGNPNSHPEQFSFGNCHGHAHYEGYADYILHTPEGQTIPIGHKNGFCVMDLECNDGGSAQYGCGNMGISRQCGDIYNKYLDCQWIDITDVDTGEYILAVKVNWDHSPDALGNYESNYNNNWAQVCIRITENGGVKGFQILQDCEPYVDCAGTPFGNAVIDCEGNCAGTMVRGDLDANSSVQIPDAALYVTGILDETLTASACKDISGDGIISVWDAGLVVNCALNSGINNCVFPNSVVNNAQVVEIGHTSINTGDGYIDVYIKNPDNKVSAYELTVSGIVISDVENLINPVSYPITPQFLPGGNKVIGISYLDSLIPKNFAPVPLVRIYYNQITGEDICVSSVVHLLNDLYQPNTVNIVDACVSILGIEERGIPSFSMFPNPSNNEVTIRLSVKLEEKMTVSITDATGRTVATRQISPMDTEITLNTEKLSNGLYNIVLSNGNVLSSKPLVVSH